MTKAVNVHYICYIKMYIIFVRCFCSEHEQNTSNKYNVHLH